MKIRHFLLSLLAVAAMQVKAQEAQPKYMRSSIYSVPSTIPTKSLELRLRRRSCKYQFPTASTIIISA